MNWEDVRALAAVARRRTLRSAAAETGLSAATLSRRIDELEAALGEKLIERLPAGCIPTTAGDRVIAWARQMEEVALEIERFRDLKGAHSPEGTVRVNADEWTSFLLTTRIAPLNKLFPNLAIEIATSHRPYSLSRREADISVRPFRPAGSELVARKAGRLDYGLYGSRAFVAQHLDAVTAREWSKLPLVGFDEPRSGFEAEQWLRSLPGAPMPWLRCSYALGIYDGVCGGAGLGVLANAIAEGNGDLVPIIPRIAELDQEIWVSIHRAVRGSARITAVTDFLAGVF